MTISLNPGSQPGGHSGDDSPNVVPFQPEPLETEFRVLPYPSGVQARATVRFWRPGDSRRCRLCGDGCTARHDRNYCLVLEDEPIPVAFSAARKAE